MPKTLFIDSTPDIDRVWKQVHGPSDIAITVNQGPVAAADIPRLIDGYDTVIDDATYFNEETLTRCTGRPRASAMTACPASWYAVAISVGEKVMGVSISADGAAGKRLR